MNTPLSWRSPRPWFAAVMMKQIMNARMAAVALAASAFIAAPALADPVGGQVTRLDTRLGPQTGLTVQVRHGGSHAHGRGYYRTNEWGQSRDQARYLRRSAVQACRTAIGRTAWRAGFRDIDFDDDRRVRQVGPNGFDIRFEEVEFESRRRDRERDVHCTVRRGQVIRLEGIPHAGPGKGHWKQKHRYGY